MTETEFFEANQWLAEWLASRMESRFQRCERDFAESFALEGLLRAARSWKPDAGTKPATWATICIRSAILDGWVKLKRQHERGKRRLRRHELEDKHFAPEPEDDFDELRERLLAVVGRAKMPNHYRELLLAKVFEGKSTREFAEERGLNLSSAVMMSTNAIRAVQEFIAGNRPEVLKKKNCVICGKSLGALGLVCSAVCRGKLRSQKNEKKRQEQLRPCEWCGKVIPFCRSYSRKRFCDRVCAGFNSQSGRTTRNEKNNGTATKPN